MTGDIYSVVLEYHTSTELTVLLCTLEYSAVVLHPKCAAFSVRILFFARSNTPTYSSPSKTVSGHGDHRARHLLFEGYSVLDLTERRLNDEVGSGTSLCLPLVA